MFFDTFTQFHLHPMLHNHSPWRKKLFINFFYGCITFKLCVRPLILFNIWKEAAVCSVTQSQQSHCCSYEAALFIVGLLHEGENARRRSHWSPSCNLAITSVFWILLNCIFFPPSSTEFCCHWGQMYIVGPVSVNSWKMVSAVVKIFL